MSRTFVKTIETVLLVLIGAILGWGSAVHLAEREPAVVVVRRDDRPFVPGLPRPSAGSLASGRLRAAGDATSAGTAALGAALDAAIDAAPGEAAGNSRTPRGWAACLTLHAMAGRTEEFLRLAPDALRDGLGAAELLDLVRLLPLAQRADALDRLLAGSPETAWPPRLVADLFVEAGAPGRAIDVLGSALEAAPHRDLIARLVAVDPDRAAVWLSALSREAAWSTDRLEQVGAAFVKAGRAPLAVAFLVAALEQEPEDRSVLERLGQIAPAAALAHARGLTQRSGAAPSAWLSLGALEAAAGNGAAAFEAYRQAASRSPTKDALMGMLRADPSRAYGAALDLIGTGPLADDEVLGAVARLALAADRPADSIDALRRAHERDPADSTWSAALVAMDPARAAQVLAASAQAYRGRRRDEVVGAYGDALLASGKAPEAFEQYARAFEMDPDDRGWLRGLSRADPARAIPLLEARRRAVGDRGEVLGALADAYAGAGRREEARSLYERAAEKDGRLEWYARMALVDPAGARSRLEEATTKAPSSVEAWGALGDCRRLLGDAAAARDAYAHARTLDPTSLVWEARWRATASGTH